MKKFILFLSSILVVLSAWANPVGFWSLDDNAFPVFNYTGDFPFKTYSKDGSLAPEPDDPYFILGNYRLTLFAHVSGQLEVITGERFWARMNQGNEKWTGSNMAEITVDEEAFQLIGKGSLAENKEQVQVKSGTGFIQYDYQLNDLKCSRIISTKPSMEPNTGSPGYVTRVVLKNNGEKAVSVKYSELVRANYEMMYQQRSPKKVDYFPFVVELKENQTVAARFNVSTTFPYLWKSKNEQAEYEGFPPSLVLHSLSEELKINSKKEQEKTWLSVENTISIKPGEEIQFDWLTGIVYENSDSEVDDLISSLQPDAKTGPLFRDWWKKRLPDFSAEKNDEIRRELIWHAYTLECMATYSSYFGETKIPSGTRYDYQWGIHVCARDHFQELIPTFYYNPELGKSGLRYMMRKMMMNGDMKQDEIGMGIITARMFQQSDNQLFFFWSLAEYLRITGDYDFLLEEINYYPMYNQTRANMIERLRTAFDYLQIEVGRGPRGLIRLLNSDWNDDVHFVYNPAPYNRVWENGESLVNTGMALVMLERLSEQLQVVNGKEGFENEQQNINWLIDAFSKYRKELLPAYQKELENRSFLRRAYFTGDQLLGEHEVYLLPQAFALQVAEVSIQKKNEIHNQVTTRLNEKLGFRNREFSTRNHFAEPGMGENGGFWWVPNSQYIIGVSQFDKDEAQQLYKKQLLSSHARQFPDKWLGYWSASDFVVSSKNIREGQSAGLPYSALPHAFNLYLWFKLFNDKPINR